MELSHALIVLLCFSMDGFVTMLKKGSSLKELPVRKGLVYSLIFSAVNGAAILAGYLLAQLFRGLLPRRAEIVTAILIVFAIGLFFTTRAIHARWEEERLDRNFNEACCLRLAVRCAPGTVLIGVGCFLMGFPLGAMVLMAMAITFVFILISLYTGYHLGSPLSRMAAVISGSMMMLYSCYLMAVYVIGPRF